MDKKLKAIFREDARRIVSRDRSARKYGQSIDLAGEITAAMVTAYNLGLEDGQAPQDASTPSHMMEAALDWELVPPTSRNVLRSLTYTYSARFDTPRFAPDELRGYLDPQTGRLRWRVIADDGEATNNGQTFADKGVSPLLRLGLLAREADNAEHLVLTPKGDATCRLYWPRDDRNDPTLPVRSARG